jgi:hypothetical protein
LDFDRKINEFPKAAPGPHRFPDLPDVIPPFREDHLETLPPGPSNPQPSPKDLLNQFNNPISFESKDVSDAGGVLKWSGNGLIGSTEASRTNPLTQGGAAPEIRSPVQRELLRYRRLADGSAPISSQDAAPAMPVVQPNAISVPERPLPGTFSGEPMSLRPLPPQVFGLPDKSDAPDGNDWFKFFAGLAR